MYESRLKSSWTHLITPSLNFVDVRWRFFQSTTLPKRCTCYNAPPTSRKRAADRWSVWNFLPRSSLLMVGKAQKSHGARSELNSVFGLEEMDQWNPMRTSAIQSASHPIRFLAFSSHENGAPRQEISKWLTVWSTFSRSRWSVVRSASLAKRGTWKKRPSPHLHRVPTRSNKVSPRTFKRPSYLISGDFFVCRIYNIQRDKILVTAWYCQYNDWLRNFKMRMRWAGHVVRMVERRNSYKILVYIPEGKRRLGRSRRRWDASIRMDRIQTGSEGVYWIHLAQDRNQWRAVVNTVMNRRVPWKA
jgi:hypothetical protein